MILYHKPDIYFGTFTQSSFTWALENDVDIITMSVSAGLTSDWYGDIYTQLYNNGTIMNASAGNVAELGIKHPAKHWTWNAISAYRLINNIPIRESYSSIGDDLFISSLTGMDINGTYFNGTSCATPIFSSMIGLYIDKYGDLPNDEFREIIKLNSTDMETVGFDDLSGFGLFFICQIMWMILYFVDIKLHWIDRQIMVGIISGEIIFVKRI